jgi:hypothetical protein
MDDPTERARRDRLVEINAVPGSRERLEAEYDQVWNAGEFSREFEVIGFLAPFVAALRKADGKRGCLEFQHHPRLYFNWLPHEER